MVLFNYSTRELTAKIVYYGPGLCGKTTNLQFIHQNLPDPVKGKMLSLATKTDRTLFFDFLPIELGDIRGMKTRVQLYTVPGQVFYNETRKLVLKGADGIVFVADSQEQMLGANVESFRNLEENLKSHGMTLRDIPHVIQFNKRDLPKLSGVEQMNSSINVYNSPFYESVATTGIGVQDTLKAICKLVLLHLTKKYDPQAATEPAARPPAPSPAPQPAAPSPAAEPPAPLPAVEPAAPPAAAPVASAEVGATDAEPPAAAAAAPSAAPTFEEPKLEPVPMFAEREIDALVDEVEEAQTPSAPSPGEKEPVAPAATVEMESPAADLRLEVDRDFDPEWQPESLEKQEQAGQAEPLAAAPSGEQAQAAVGESQATLGESVETPEAGTPIPVQHVGEDSTEARGRSDDAVVLLTDTVQDKELFEDPDLDVARLAPGESREIVVPVELGEGQAVRRFKLSLTLKLEPLD